MSLYCFWRERRRGMVKREDDCADFLAPSLAGNAEHGGFGDRGMGQEGVDDLRGIDVLPSADDHLLLAPEHSELAVAATGTEVPGPVPAVPEGGGRRIGVPPVAAHNAGAPDADLADVAVRQRSPVFVEDCDVGVDHRPTDRVHEPAASRVVVRHLMACEAGRFRQAVGLEEIAAEHRAAPREDGLLHRGSAVAHAIQRAEVAGGVRRIAYDHVEQSRRQTGHRHALSLCQSSEDSRFEMRCHVLRADHRDSPDREGVDEVEHGGSVQPGVPLPHPKRNRGIERAGEQIGLSQAYSLWLPGRSARKKNLGYVVRLERRGADGSPAREKDLVFAPFGIEVGIIPDDHVLRRRSAGWQSCEEQLRLRYPQDVVDLDRCEADVDRHQDDAGMRARVVDLQVADGVVREDSNPVALLDAARPQRSGEADDPVGEFCICDALLAVDHGRAVAIQSSRSVYDPVQWKHAPLYGPDVKKSSKRRSQGRINMPHVEVTTFGGLQLTGVGGRRIRLPTRKAAGLLAFLAMHPGRDWHRDSLAALLWGGSVDDRARQSLRQALTDIRHACGPEILAAAGQRIRAVAEALSVDALQYEKLVSLGTVTSLDQAEKLYKGDFLAFGELGEEEYDDWLAEERERLSTLVQQALVKTIAMRAGDSTAEKRVAAATSLLKLDPYDEGAHRTIIEAYANRGQHAKAVVHYGRLRAALRLEIGVEPEPQTRALHDRIAQAARQQDTSTTLLSFTFVLEQLPHPVVVTDVQNSIVGWNGRAEQIFGYSKQEMYGRSPTMIYAPRRNDALADVILSRAIRKGRWVGDVVIFGKDGREQRQKRIVTPLFDGSGNLIGAFGHGITR